MEQNVKHQIYKDTQAKLLKNRDQITLAVTVYGEYVYDAFERMLKLSTWTEGPYVVNTVYVLIGRTTGRAYCYIEGLNTETGELIPNLADWNYDTGESFFADEADEIIDDLGFLDFDEIEDAWEILYNRVLPKEIKTEIIYDYQPLYMSYKGEPLEDGTEEILTSITIWWDP